MSNLYENLSWLPKAPEDFSRKVSMAQSGKELLELAKHALDETQLNRLCKKVKNLQDNSINLNPLVEMNIGVISNATTKLLTPVLVGTALRFGISLGVIEAEFNQVAQEAYSENSAFSGNSLASVLIAIDYRGLPFVESPGEELAAKKNVAECLSFIRGIADAIQEKTGAQIILQNIAPPAERVFGSYEWRVPGTLSWLIAEFNNQLNALADRNVLILDVAGLASIMGLANWHDPTLWNMAKVSFSQRYAPIYADYICRLLSARLGKSRRCLILDLDNTLWGGIIGDDGIDGILIGNGEPTAEAHLHIQRTALELRGRGIVLAVSSKNEDAIARGPFKERADMVLREQHFAAFQANWSDKASNIKAIAESLSLGLESMVFLDDNPAERMQVRRELPEVAVPELPDNPALYVRTLIAAGYFEVVAFLEEDRQRAGFYQENAKRAQLLDKSSDMDAYLKSLDMKISFSPFSESGRARIAQLISKSNQFNLTTKRYSELDIKTIEEDSQFFTRQIRLSDVLGDNGMICVVVCKKHSDAWEIDTWLMSCRVLGRRVELATLQDIVMNAKNCGATKIIGRYIPTLRNMIVKDHYKKLGFVKISSDEKSEIWELNIDKYKFIDVPMLQLRDQKS